MINRIFTATSRPVKSAIGRDGMEGANQDGRPVSGGVSKWVELSGHKRTIICMLLPGTAVQNVSDGDHRRPDLVVRIVEMR